MAPCTVAAGKSEHQIVAAGDELLSGRGPDRAALYRAEQFPPRKRRRVDAQAALALPDRDRFRFRNRSGHAALVEMIPQRIEAPCEVFQGIAEMGHLPVEDRENPSAPVM